MSSRTSMSSSTISTQGMSGEPTGSIYPWQRYFSGTRATDPGTLTSTFELDGGTTHPGAFDYSREVANQLDKCVPISLSVLAGCMLTTDRQARRGFFRSPDDHGVPT